MNKPVRGALDEAQAMLYKVEMLQALCLASQNSLDAQYGMIDYADLLNEFLPRLQAAINDAERALCQ